VGCVWEGQALLVHVEPGAGKTVLLDYLTGPASEGCRAGVLRWAAVADTKTGKWQTAAILRALTGGATSPSRPRSLCRAATSPFLCPSPAFT
jgi:hypothetical protein